MIYLILASSWRALPFITLLLLAAMQTVPRRDHREQPHRRRQRLAGHSPYHDSADAADDGGGDLQPHPQRHERCRHDLQPDRRRARVSRREVLSYMLYTIGWRQLEFGRAAALALLIAIVNWALIMGTLRLTRVEERSH